MANLHPTSCALPTNLESSFCLNILLILLKMSLQETHQNHSEPLIPVTGELWRSARQSHPMRVHLSPTNRILILLGTDPAEVCLVERKIHTLPTKNKKTKPYRMGRMPCQEHTQKYHLAWASLKSSHWLTYVFFNGNQDWFLQNDL